MMRYFVLLALFNFALGDPEVQVANGRLRGRELRNIYGKTYYSFQKVPFGVPPLGNLRFQAPRPANNWNGLYDASRTINVVCHQMYQDNPQESEDCLYLNVFTPQLPSGGNNVSLPVMFWVYGGGFTFGSAGEYGPDYLLQNDVIVVTANYRLGAFGFLSTEDDVIPGNAGLKDQLLALKWVHANIKAFGGNPNKITIFGESAGGVSVSYHLLNTKAQGLYVGAIMQSGSSLMPCCMTKNPKNIAFETAAILDPRFKLNRNSKDLLAYLQNVRASDLERASQQFNGRLTTANRDIYQGYNFAPVIEAKNVPDAIINEKMYGRWKRGDFVKVPVILGMNSEENLFESGNAGALRNMLNSYDNNLDWLVPVGMRINDRNQKLDMGRKIRSIYTGNAPLANNLGHGVRLASDNCFTRGIIKQGELQSKSAPVYFYQFSYNGVQLGRTGVSYEGAEKVAHGADIHYIWNRGNINQYPVPDRNVHWRIQKLWTDFAKFQNPTPQKSDILQNVIWPTVNSGRPDQYLYLDINANLEIKNQPKVATYSKWNDLFKSLGHDDFDTY